MSLANVDLDGLRVKIRSAYSADDPYLARFRNYARRLRDGVKPLRAHSVNAVSFVSTDGGDNRITFNPAVIELVRVVDSRGNQCVLDAIPSTISLAELEQRALPDGPASTAPLACLCRDVGQTLSGLSYLIRGVGQPGKTTGALRCYRDIVEWAVLYDLIVNPSLQWGGNTILIRDGLLRTKSFTRDVFPEIDKRIRQGVAEHARRNVQISLVGVAKQSAVLSKLAVALELEGAFHKPYPCYVKVDEDIEADCYNFDRTWLDTYESVDSDNGGAPKYQSMGQLFLAKFGDMPDDPVWPVDVAVWQKERAAEVLGQLMVDAQQGFPIPDYPMCIQKAHDHAKLTGLEVEILQDLLVQIMSERLNDRETERLLRMKHLGRSLAALRYKEA